MNINKEADRILKECVGEMAMRNSYEARMTPGGQGTVPSIPALNEIMQILRGIIFPEFFDRRRTGKDARTYYIGAGMERLYFLLVKEVSHGMCYGCPMTEEEVKENASSRVLKFIECLPEIKRLLYTDVQAMYDNDPAVDNYGEVILCYPTITAMLHYRIAHSLLKCDIPVIPRVLTELAHSSTGIDINPGAEIGEYFAIDHGTGVVVGQTAIIGNHVTLYQGVTLGARNFTLDSHGHPVNTPRHPIIEDNVTVYSNASILGRITVGHDSIIGGNVWLTTSVPPCSKILQQKASTTQ